MMTYEERVKQIDDHFDNISLEEFEQALIRAGIEDCPYEDEWERYYITGV